MNILNETRQFVNKFVSESLFDTSMVQCMKTVLSYVEKKTDIILSDYQYLLCIPLIVAYAELRWLLSQPGELIGQYFSLIAIVKQFDKTAGIRASIDDVKEYETVAQMLETLDRYDPLLREKLEKYMSVEANRKSMSILYRKFVQSLGFSYLNVDSCLFLWDQLFLKVKPMEDDMQLAFVAMILACREEILLTNQFSECAEMIYMKGKATSIDVYISKYIQVAAGRDYYIDRYNHEEIPVEAIRLDKVNLEPKHGGQTVQQPTAAEVKLIEDNMARILRENVIPESEPVLPGGEGLLIDPSLL